MTIDLAPEERRALAALLKSTVNEGQPHSPRIRVLSGILARLEPPAREGVSILGRNAVEIRRTTARLIIRGIVSVLIVLVFVALRSRPSWVGLTQTRMASIPSSWTSTASSTSSA